MPRSLVAALVALAVTPSAASAFTRVVSAYAFKDGNGVHFLFRTDRPLQPVKIGFPQVDTSLYPGPYFVSRALNCYEGMVNRGGVRVGDRVRVRIGKHGQILDRRFTVKPNRPGYARGGLIGCRQDPKATAMIFNMYPVPAVEPVRYFFSANAGPYLDKLRWRGWGTDRAVARGTYISDCASCGPKIVHRTRVVLHTIPCDSWGGVAYVGYAVAYGSGKAKRVPVGDSNYCT